MNTLEKTESELKGIMTHEKNRLEKAKRSLEYKLQNPELNDSEKSDILRVIERVKLDISQSNLKLSQFSPDEAFQQIINEE